jgi:uroporphyrinogen decarboxylase
MMYNEPATVHLLLDKLAQSVTSYLNAQIAAGAQVVQIFDTWGGALSTPAFREFSLRYMQQIVSGLTREADGRVVPVILFTKGGGQWVEESVATGADCIGLDWTVELGDIRARTKDGVSLQGNMDPGLLYARPEIIDAEVARILASFGQHSATSGHVFNLGHGIHPEINPEHVKAYVDAVHVHGKQFH